MAPSVNSPSRQPTGNHEAAATRPRPWWKKKRFVIPGALIVAFAAIDGGNADEQPAAVAAELPDSASTSTPTSEALPATTTSTTTSDDTTNATSAELDDPEAVAPTTTPATIAEDTGYVSELEFPVSEQTVAIAFDALNAATVLDELGAPVPYRRAEYSDGWDDADGDCLSDRHEILLERSEVPAEIDGCNVVAGQWTDPYDGTVYTNARLVTIDHFVPLAAAHRAGAWAWDLATKQAFAADITHRPSHVPAGQSTNEQKGDSEPHEWRPSRSAWCGYAINWISVKTRWELTYSTAEAAALREMLDTCEPTDTANSPTTTAPPAAPATSSTTTSSSTTIVLTPGAAVVEVSFCDARGETVELRNTGSERIALIGWTLHDEGRKHETNLNRVVLNAGESFIMLSGEDTLETPGSLRWTGRNVWNNDGDIAFLLGPDGSVVSERRCAT